MNQYPRSTLMNRGVSLISKATNYKDRSNAMPLGDFDNKVNSP